jgi:2-methylcitrate dehydratase PrpD
MTSDRSEAQDEVTFKRFRRPVRRCQDPRCVANRLGNKGMGMTNTTRTLAETVTGIGAGDIDAEARRATARIFMDGLAVGVAGACETAPRHTYQVQIALAAPGKSTVIGFPARLTPVAAACVNGASMHVLDFEPMWSPPNHAVSTTLPAALALAQEIGSDGSALGTALLKGVEMQGRLRVASGQFEPREFTFHPPGFVGPLGAATAAAHLLDLDAEAFGYALGIAGSRAGTLLANAGSMTKCLHCGMAAADGLEAGLLAARGITAHADIIDAPAGYAEGFMPKLDRGLLLEYGAPWRVLDPGYVLKQFPSQYGTHFAITAALEISAQLVPGDVIERIEILSPVMPYVDRPDPKDGLDGKFSFQYTASAALLDGEVVIDSFRDERRFCDDMTAMLGRVQLTQDAAIPAALETMHVEVSVTLGDGRVLWARCDGPKGSIQGPPLEDADHMAKVRACLTTSMDATAVDETIALCSNLFDLGAKDIERLCGLMAGSDI